MTQSTLLTRESIERLRNAAPALAEALLDMHLYGQTDFAYLRSPSGAKTQQALVDAGILTAGGSQTDAWRAFQQTARGNTPELLDALETLYQAFLNRHEGFPTDRVTAEQRLWRAAMVQASTLLKQHGR